MAMFRAMGNRIRQYLSRPKAVWPGQEEGSAAQARQDRVDTMQRLQHDVRRLQQEITDLSEASGAPSAAAPADAERLTGLYRELEQRQGELARYQGRI
jgi:hypothetical protein